jgi:hypothetical protein
MQRTESIRVNWLALAGAGLGAIAALAGCVATDAGEDDTSALDQDVAVPGSWALSAQVHEIAQTQFVAYDEAPDWDGGANCSGTFFSGTAKLRTYLSANFPDISSIGGYACRQNTADLAKTSMHGSGRALDVFIPESGGAADNTKGDRVAAWLLTHAEFIGVQLVIWDHSIWSPSRATGEKLHAYGGPIPHIDHLHVEITNEAAAEHTAFFQAAADIGWSQIVRADLDGNGDDELGFYTTRDGTFAWYPMTTAGQLGTRLSSSDLGNSWDVILGVDPDGDGIDDLAFYNAKTGGFEVYAAAASGVLGSQRSSTTLGTGWTTILAADFDGDHRDELAFYNAANGAYAVYHTNANGTLGTRLVATTFSTGWSEIIALDVTGDGHPELGFYNKANGSFAVYPTTTAGALDTRLSATTLSEGWTAVEPAQIAGDARPELVFYDRVSGGFAAYTLGATGLLAARLAAFTLN